MFIRLPKRGHGRPPLQILCLVTSILYPQYQRAEDDYHSHGNATVDAYSNRLAMLFCLQGGKNIDSDVDITN